MRLFKNLSMLRLAAVAALLALALISPAGAQTYIEGIDVSHWQGSINWTSVRNSGVEFAFMKATQGTTYVDPTFAANAQNATNAGVLVGPYHFCNLNTDTSNPLDPVNEANHFLDVIQPYYNSGLYLPPVADVEGFPAFGSTAEARAFTSAWVQSFSDTIYGALGVRPIIYGSLSTANSYYTSSVASQHELWLAWWKSSGTSNPPTPADTPLWGPWQFWQWTDSGSIPGIAGNVDRDLFNGTRAQLESLLIGPGSGGPGGITMISDFNADEGYFGWSPTYSGSNRNINAVTADQVSSEAYEGAGSERIVVDGDNWTLRFLSGIGARPAKPESNLALPATGSIGYWLKTTDPGVTTHIAIDDPTSATGEIEGGSVKNVIADGQWHLYEWNFEDDAQWNSFFEGDGSITNPFVTIDSIVFKGVGDATIYLDAVAHNPDGSLGFPPGDFNGDYAVDADDLTDWQNSYGPGNPGGDADDDGDTDGADFLLWQRNLTSATATAAATPVPEPAALALSALALCLCHWRPASALCHWLCLCHWRPASAKRVHGSA
jgi:GH25 family lysozyme M1 (1,4-beta-N-acetylmuramidase)